MSRYQVGHPFLPALSEIKEKHFENVYSKYFQKIYGICRRYSSKPDDAKDLAHDVFVLYYQNFDKFRHESSPSTWMYRVAVNLGIQKWRKERIRHVVDMELESIPAENHDNEIMLLDRITLTKILGRYPERTRKILLLHHFERRSQIEIGKLLGISRTTVTRHLLHFRVSCRHLRKTATRPPSIQSA